MKNYPIPTTLVHKPQCILSLPSGFILGTSGSCLTALRGAPGPSTPKLRIPIYNDERDSADANKIVVTGAGLSTPSELHAVSWDGHLTVISVDPELRRRPQILKRIKVHNGFGKALACGNGVTVTGGSAGDLCFLRDGEIFARAPSAHTGSVNCITYLPSLDLFATLGTDGALSLYSPSGLRVAHAADADTTSLLAVAPVPGHPYLLAGSADGRVCVWRCDAEGPVLQRVAVLEAPTSAWVTALAVAPATGAGEIGVAYVGTSDGSIARFVLRSAVAAGRAVVDAAIAANQRVRASRAITINDATINGVKVEARAQALRVIDVHEPEVVFQASGFVAAHGATNGGVTGLVVVGDSVVSCGGDAKVVEWQKVHWEEHGGDEEVEIDAELDLRGDDEDIEELDDVECEECEEEETEYGRELREFMHRSRQ